jgi:hypothetical protein
MHGLERPAECLCRAVAVAHGDAEQVPDPRDDLRRRDRHAPATHVLGQRHPCQRGEHATQADGDLHAGRAVLDRLEVAEVAVELVVGVLGHGAGAEQTTSGCAPSVTGA